MVFCWWHCHYSPNPVGNSSRKGVSCYKLQKYWQPLAMSGGLTHFHLTKSGIFYFLEQTLGQESIVKYLLRRYLDPPNPPQTPSKRRYLELYRHITYIYICNSHPIHCSQLFLPHDFPF